MWSLRLSSAAYGTLPPMNDPVDGGRATDRLPVGVVTFLFTDIEGSTRLVRDLEEQYLHLQAAHDAVMRDAIAKHNGVEVRTEGDSFFAVFTSPREALVAVVAAQRALASTDWPAEAVVRIRMGLHTGTGTLGGDNYVGLDVHLAARIAAAAHGGQVLVSEATRALVAEDISGEFGFRDLGSYRLKDFERPARLYQLTADDLVIEFPPPRASRVGNLPAPRTSFVGRREVLDEVQGLLANTSLLVLTGPGGAGKTRLSLELARSVADQHADGAFFVPLDAITDVRLVPSAILQVLEVPGGTRPADETIREALAPLQVLLVLDNLEQIPDVGGVIDELLQATPSKEGELTRDPRLQKIFAA